LKEKNDTAQVMAGIENLARNSSVSVGILMPTFAKKRYQKNMFSFYYSV
jgi:ABC-type xylose transport system substrate-binding protein